jgi:DNA-binding PadR family transcriptional regulator
MDAKTLCLAVLSRGDASGYEIKKALEEAPFSHFQDTGFGSIYPALGKLTDADLIHGTAMAQEKRPDKKVYAITEAGRRALIEALLEPPAPDRYRSDFLFVLFLGHLLTSAHLVEIVDQRIAFYEAQIARMEGCALEHRPVGQQLVHGFGLTIYRAAAQYLRDNRAALLTAAAEAPGKAAAEAPGKAPGPDPVPAMVAE